MRTLIPVLAVLAILAVLALRGRSWLSRSPQPIVIQSLGPTVERLQKLSHLVTTKVLIADVLVGEGEGHVGAWLVKGDALLGVDLSRAKIIAKDDAARRATIQLPLPELLTSRVDHSRTQTWQVRKTAWLPWSGDGDKLRDQVMREAQKLVAQAASSEEYISQSKGAADAIIAAFYAEVGWSVLVEWSGKPGRRDRCRRSIAVGRHRVRGLHQSRRAWRSLTGRKMGYKNRAAARRSKREKR